MELPRSLIATHSGLRGRPGAELSADVVRTVIGGLARLLEQRRLPMVVAVARDQRPSGEEFSAAVIEAALASGIGVVDLGVQSTPAAKLAARNRGLGGAVIVTGSHLEPQLNGLKLVAAPSYAPVDVRALQPGPPSPSPRPGRLRSDTSAAEEHVAAVRASIDSETVAGAGLAVRCEGGAGPAPVLLLEHLRCAARGPTADVGLRLDADADRLSLLDETGAELDTELTFPLVMLAHGARRVVKGADTSRLVEAMVRERGGSVRTVPPGEIHLVEALMEGEAELAGEGNGGVIVPAVGLARDGLAAAAAVLWLIARSGRPLSVLAGELPRQALRRSTLPFADPGSRREALERLASRSRVELRQPEVGVLVEPAADVWGLVRASATEPVIRVTVEAPTESQAEELHDQLVEAIDPNGLSS
jgi:phosphomannomutase